MEVASVTALSSVEQGASDGRRACDWAERGRTDLLEGGLVLVGEVARMAGERILRAGEWEERACGELR